MEWTSVSSVFRVGQSVYKNRHVIQHYWTKLKVKFNFGKAQIIVTGAPNAGKSLLSAQIHGKGRELFFVTPEASSTVEASAIQFGEWTRLVKVLPGQVGLRTEGELDAYAKRSALEGIIHVVDWGYSVPRDPVVLQSWVEQDGVVTIEQLRTQNLQTELDALKLELGNVRKLHHQEKRPKWLVVAVNKVDLFFDQLPSALKYYHPDGGSPFSRALSELQKDLGTSNFAVYVMNVCAHEERMVFNGHIVESSLEKGKKDELLRNFSRTVSKITDQHA